MHQVAAKCGVEATPEPSWASHVLEMGVKLPEPQLPALEDLFAKNIQAMFAAFQAISSRSVVVHIACT